ncbi:MAG: hypothetical protein M3494_06135 [Actinomycetota bacterium]|nr:hypothetical protein [Actinomycetota bacterium]
MGNKVLGAIAMVCAPALLVEAIVTRGGESNPVVIGTASMVFMLGWLCSNTAMRRMHAAGTGKWGRAVLAIQLVGIVLAFFFGFFEATGLLGRESIIFNVTDVAWPLSMVWMLLPVGITVIVAKRLEGWRRFVPMLCGAWFPVAMVGAILFGEPGGIVGLAMTMVGWMLLGCVVFTSEESAAKSVAPTTEPAVR